MLTLAPRDVRPLEVKASCYALLALTRDCRRPWRSHRVRAIFILRAMRRPGYVQSWQAAGDAAWIAETLDDVVEAALAISEEPENYFAPWLEVKG